MSLFWLVYVHIMNFHIGCEFLLAVSWMVTTHLLLLPASSCERLCNDALSVCLSVCPVENSCSDVQLVCCSSGAGSLYLPPAPERGSERAASCWEPRCEVQARRTCCDCGWCRFSADHAGAARSACDARRRGVVLLQGVRQPGAGRLLAQGRPQDHHRPTAVWHDWITVQLIALISYNYWRWPHSMWEGSM